MSAPNTETFTCADCGQARPEVIVGVRPYCNECAADRLHHERPYQPQPYVGGKHAAPAAYVAGAQAPVQQVIIGNDQRKRCRHGLHLILTLVTGGLWLPVWIIDAIVKGK